MLKTFKIIFILVIATMVISACSQASFKQESNSALKIVKETINKTPKKANKKNENLRFYLPFGFEIKKQSPHNTILKNGSKTYILFNNPHENNSSDVVYKATVAQYKKLEMNKIFKDKKKFGYLIIEKLKDDKNEMTIGIGGTKITTQTKTSSLKSEAEAMMQIISSIKTGK
jgi:outer membrane lipoprotein-sorting protein